MRMRKKNNLQSRMDACSEYWIQNPETYKGRWRELMPGCSQLRVEVGCGKGRFLTGRAAANPDMDFLGIERMLGRVHSFDDKCRRLKISNAHVLRLEALYTFWYLLPAHSVKTVYVFFPDPWPKKKHHSHRLFGPIFLKALWKRLAPGGRLEFATDHEEYFQWVCEKMDASPLFTRAEWNAPFYPKTDFQQQWEAMGKPIFAARFVRNS